jgi:hypothetical protein
MARWAPEETDTMAALATEITGTHGVTRTLVAVDGQPGADVGHVADALVRAFTEQGVTAMHAAATSTDIDGLRAEVVDPFRTTGTAAGVLVVTGTHLLATKARSLWSWTLWVEADPDLRLADDDPYVAYLRHDDPKGHASAVLDTSDAAHPRRNWNDAC